MSHDRGCSCGKEPFEYADCVEPNCFKKDNRMEDTDWRPSSCPVWSLSSSRKKSRVYQPQVCNSPMGERTMIKQEPERYVWVRADGEAKIVDTDIVELWQGPYFDREKDRIYRLGEEVEIKVTVQVKNKKPVYRENALGYRVPFENRD